MRRLSVKLLVALTILSASQPLSFAAKPELLHPTTPTTQTNSVTTVIPVKMMGVSCYGCVTDQSSSAKTSAAPKIASSQIKAAKSGDDLEAILDSWQKGAKRLWAAASPQVVSFFSMAMQRLGINHTDAQPKLAFKQVTPKKTNLASVAVPLSNKHKAWLLPDGRLKTVAAQ